MNTQSRLFVLQKTRYLVNSETEVAVNFGGSFLSASSYVQSVYKIVELIAGYTLVRGQRAELESSLLSTILSEVVAV